MESVTLTAQGEFQTVRLGLYNVKLSPDALHKCYSLMINWRGVRYRKDYAVQVVSGEKVTFSLISSDLIRIESGDRLKGVVDYVTDKGYYLTFSPE